jgi:GNAT superfamily N-acetyltransferase
MVDEIKEKALREQATDYCKQDETFYTDISECILRGAAEILFASSQGVLLREKSSGILMLAADTMSAANAALESLKAKQTSVGGWLVAHGELARDAVYPYFTVERAKSCYQVAYLGKTPFPLKGSLTFRYPERAEIDVIKREYALESPENIEKLCAAKKIVCGFANGVFVGFIGSHPEGSMGLLQVFPEYRRLGYGEELERYMINAYLKAGRVPYGHIIEDNVRSLNLQKKLGYQLSDKKIYWMYLS